MWEVKGGGGAMPVTARPPSGRVISRNRTGELTLVGDSVDIHPSSADLLVSQPFPW